MARDKPSRGGRVTPRQSRSRQIGVRPLKAIGGEVPALWELAMAAVTGPGPVLKVTVPEDPLLRMANDGQALLEAVFQLLGLLGVSVRRLAALQGSPPDVVLTRTLLALTSGEV